MTTSKLLALRTLMKQLPSIGGSIQAYIIPTDDAHQSEYICERDERRAFVSGFDGSAGTAVVTDTAALLWTDGRYYEQATQQLDANWSLMRDGQTTTPSIGSWLAKNLPNGSRIGVDPLVMSYRMWSTISGDLSANECSLVAIRQNLIDAIWPDQPAAPNSRCITLGLQYAGATCKTKVDEIRRQMTEKGAQAMVVTALDEIAWFLNMRGSDIDFNPVFFAYLLITHDEIHLFMNESKLPENFQEHQKENGVLIAVNKYDQIEEVLSAIQGKLAGGERVWISPTSNYLLNSLVDEKRRQQEITAICQMKAIKNPVEVEGLIKCHIRDGKALCQYFAWLENELDLGNHVDEISGASKLEEFRSKLAHFMGLSFTTISGFGPNGSVIHYHPKPETNLRITKDGVYLCDSGAQFLDGTTDVTRTWHFGVPTHYQMECFTRVLKGQINMGTAIFPQKIKGNVLDTLARKFLWDVGLDYGHGTGHGIGHFLNVHEGPMGIGTRAQVDDPGLQVNMFMSNEPGYYEVGQFGIRIEDIVQIIAAPIERNFGGRGALAFKTVTMCPIQTKLIDVTLLTDTELSHVNDYHRQVWALVAPQLEADNDQFTLAWLKKETEPVQRA